MAVKTRRSKKADIEILRVLAIGYRSFFFILELHGHSLAMLLLLARASVAESGEVSDSGEA
jgi:hypothetical protein